VCEVFTKGLIGNAVEDWLGSRNKLTVAFLCVEIVDISKLTLVRIALAGTLHVARFAVLRTFYAKMPRIVYILHEY